MTVARRIDLLADSPTLAVDAKAKALKAAGAPVIGFGAGEPDFPTPGHIVEAAARAAADPAMHRYTPAAGLPTLREAVAAVHRADGWPVEPSQVTIANGGKHALYNVFMTLIDPGDEVLVPAPYWVTYPEQIALAGGVPVAVATSAASGFRVTVEQLEAARTPRTRAVVFCSPSNPTGAVHHPDEVAAIGRWAVEHGLWVVADEIYRHLVYGTATFASLPVLVPEARERTVVVDGVAKAYAMTGWRVGWSVAPPAVAAGINKLQSQLSSNVCNVAQSAAIAALTGPQDDVETMRVVFDRRRRTAVELIAAMDGVELTAPEGAFYVFPSFEAVLGRSVAGRTVSTTLELADALLDGAQVALVPGEGFGAPGFARISYALSDEDLVEGLTRIAHALAG
jgi:aspartate aminotransferase